MLDRRRRMQSHPISLQPGRPPPSTNPTRPRAEATRSSSEGTARRRLSSPLRVWRRRRRWNHLLHHLLRRPLPRLATIRSGDINKISGTRKSYRMPEFRDSKRGPLAAGEDGGEGLFIRRVATPSSLAVRATARKHRGRRFILPSNNKENMAPVWSVRAAPPKRSPLPKWYPRTPLRDITTIAKAIQRSRLRIAAAQEQGRRSEQSPQSVNVTSAQAEQDVPLSTDVSLAVASSSGSTEIGNITSPATILAEDDLKVLCSPAESPMKTPSEPTGPSITDTVEKKLSSSIEQIEKMVKKNMKRTPKAAQRSKRVIQRRTLMSLR